VRRIVVPSKSTESCPLGFGLRAGAFVLLPKPQKNQKGVPQNAADFGLAASITWDSGVCLASELDKGLLP
jgi:hypothetical protein